MRTILDLSQAELAQIAQPKFRAKQIFEWIYKKNVREFDDMKNLPKELRESLSSEFYIDSVRLIRSEKSQDGSIKYLFALRDGKTIESVLLPMKEEISEEIIEPESNLSQKSNLNSNSSSNLAQNPAILSPKKPTKKIIRHARYTICVSSQVGCKMGCSFCLTAKGGFMRNLTPGEIVGQILWIKRENQIPYERRVNIVYMGMGEPLDNLANVSLAVGILSDNDGLAISPRRQTISTSGLASQIKKLGELNLGVLLAISLHAVTDELRDKLMPVNKAYNIKAVMDAVREFPIDMRKRVMFEYLIMDGVNDSKSDAKALVKLLHGIKAKVNLILFNPHEGSPYQRPSLENVEQFQSYLHERGITCTIRQSKGLDISAACGQLKERSENLKEPK